MPDAYEPQYLKGRGLKIFLAVADTILPADEHSPSGNDPTTAKVVDWAMQRLPGNLRRQFQVLLFLVEILGLFFGGRFFSSNTASNRARQLAWMESSPIRLLRMGFFGLKNYVCMGYYTREHIWPLIGFEGPMNPDIPYQDPSIRALCQAQRKAAP